MSQFRRSASVAIQTFEGNEAVIIRNLRITFEINKTEGKDPNTASIEIYNLSEATRNLVRLDTNPKSDQIITLTAGYLDGDGEEILYVGTLTSIAHSFERPLIITRIEASDGKGALDKSKVSATFGKNSSGKVILTELSNLLGIPNNLNTLAIEDKKQSFATSYIGDVKHNLTKATDFLGLSWTIQNNEVKFTLRDGDDGITALVLSPTTGMIGSPERLSGTSRKAKGESKKVTPGWRIESLLQPKVLPKNKIVLSSREIPENSIFTVTNVTHTGDTHGTVWSSRIEVKESS